MMGDMSRFESLSEARRSSTAGLPPARSRRLWWGALTAGLVLAWGEWVSWRASRQHLPAVTSAPSGEDTEAIVVLGFPSRRDGRAGMVQRYRTRIAVRSRNPAASRSVLVFTGRSPHRPGTDRSEAAVMAEYAVDVLGVDPADVVLEEEAATTWENIARTIPLIEPFAVVKIASNTFHARKARGYLCRQAPDLAARLRHAGDHRTGELTLLKPILAMIRR